ncbi:ABC transporter ATP-binding protein [Ethanoligenens harbinense]|uniref:ABC transporter related protein n=1 Tax=Ethanoligenens harbinense (strain DSM 18485 / JCM 12961 / CGMCC 1.5033 / YUAN-3) TaxID=663278 RepID=E6U627_ETHHY|nr:ABC transporter ATP-binding protein [Ethanoligenens harbinense]ADU25706.1 ABC transporter related protein [Ethanoligenens harbinense YUAN-3]AVQ94880.1 ABC transporter ATP-binding protein [Ethanoligenens harbinense YUAN-3]AYF37571.1 ABC transporter ATP-binding protein [Ethanoligenens harbinense]AYF40291.1 ABC transporter ATP-binding protein [Ethanoligenens harbinense]QCN91128.1 ABC transporter ATP-binding protein [Ethanoligenens harbinense]
MVRHGSRGSRFYHQTDEKPHITKALVFRIVAYFKPYWKIMAVILLLIVLTSAMEIVPPLLTKNIIDIALPQKNIRLLLLYIVLSFALLLLVNLISVGQSYLNTLVSKNIIRNLREDMYQHLLHMSIRFFSNVQAGEISSRINNDIGGIESVFSNTFIQILQGILVFVTTTVILLYINWKLAIISLLTLPLFLLPTRRVGRARWKIAADMQSKLAELTTLITETLNVSGMMLIKLFTKEKEEEKEFQNINDTVTKLGIRETVVGRWFIMTIQTFVAIGPMLIYLFGGLILIQYHDITIGGIVMFVTLVTRLYGPVNTFANIHVDIVRSMALFERIFQYLDLKNEIKEKPDACNIGRADGEIRFKHVFFSYKETNAPTLTDINMEIKSGQMAAFVGPSGAGKTTITYLVPRLYEVQSGAVLLDGIDIREIALHSLRNQIGMVTQDTYLFNTTIRENLLFARPNAKEAELVQACTTANIHDFIKSLPQGYDTVVGDRGIKLSGGEKQRISIARALLKDPRIVIFDEATSALDSNSETLIQQAIDPLLKTRTSLVIAHRLSTVLSADIIFVVENGHIVESGRHLDLIKLNGLYKDLYDKQFHSADESHSMQ